MSRKDREKIKTEHGGALSQANPFAAIDLNNLPEASDSKPDAVVISDKPAKSRGRVDVTREKAGRAGKLVTVLSEFPKSVSIDELSALALKLKKRCACGGSLKNRTIELQGDVCEEAISELEQQKFKPVRCGY